MFLLKALDILIKTSIIFILFSLITVTVCGLIVYLMHLYNRSYGYDTCSEDFIIIKLEDREINLLLYNFEDPDYCISYIIDHKDLYENIDYVYNTNPNYKALYSIDMDDEICFTLNKV